MERFTIKKMVLIFKLDNKDTIYLDSCCGITVVDKKDKLNKEI